MLYFMYMGKLDKVIYTVSSLIYFKNWCSVEKPSSSSTHNSRLPDLEADCIAYTQFVVLRTQKENASHWLRRVYGTVCGGGGCVRGARLRLRRRRRIVDGWFYFPLLLKAI